MNRRTGIMVAGGARARFISVEVADDEQLDGGPRLVEHAEMVNPDGEVPARGLFSDRSGRAHASSVGAAHGLDDHRDQHQEEIDRRFARSMGESAQRFIAEQQITRFIVCAEPRLLGRLRAELDPKRWRNVEVVELGEDLTRHPLRQVQQVLVRRGLVKPPHPPVAGVYRPRGQAPSWR
jgi:protein required for attachment to host cells